MRARGVRRDERGFTLVELVMAMLVIAIVMIAIITVQARALTTNADSQARQASTAFANEAMEELRAMPWYYLSTGLYSGFNAGGTDPYVSGSTLTVDGKSYALLVGSGGSDQTIGVGNGWTPLFDDAGSNVQVESAPSGNGDVITVRSYTTEDQAGSSRAVGLVVVATWTKRTDGASEETVLTSTAYAPSDGCGDLTQAPFLAACQARYESTGSTAIIDVSVTASTTNFVAARPLVPGSLYYLMQLQTSNASAGVVSQQVSTAKGFATLGGLLWDDNNALTNPLDSGFTAFAQEASDDATSGIPSDPADDTAAGSTASTTLSAGSFGVLGRSDGARTGLAQAKATAGCSTGLASSVPSNAPCAYGSVTGSATSALLQFQVGANSINFFEAQGTPTDRAWSARFPTVAGNASVGCTTITSSGCTSGGAQKTLGDVVIGQVSSGTWKSGVTGIPKTYLVKLSNYTDSARAERGVGYENAAPTIARSVGIEYWDGTAFTSFTLGSGAATQVTIPPVTWSNAAGAVTADGVISMTGTSTSVNSSPSCKDSGCSVSARNGIIEIEMNYKVTPASGTAWTLTVKTTVTGSDAAALFQKAAASA